MGEGYVKIASSSEFNGITGEYFDDKCKTVKMPRAAYDNATCKRLWNVSEEMVGFK